MLKFNECLVIVTCQYFENYGYHDWDGVGECPQRWKPKGGTTFRLVVDSDWVMYGEDRLIQCMERVFNEMGTNLVMYEYRSHEVFFEEPMDITDMIQPLLNEKVGV